MRIAVIGATGMVGSRVTAEATGRGHQVTALARRAPAPPGPAGATWVAADAADADTLRPVLAGVDAAVLSIRAASGSESTLGPSTAAVLDVAATTGTRLLVVGGAGPLRSPHDPGMKVLDDPELVPPTWQALAVASTEQLGACRRRPDADWTYLSPPALLMPGERTGSYRRGSDVLLIDAEGRSRISAEDLAVAVLDELERPSGFQHLTVAY